MRSVAEAPKTRFLGQVAAIALLAGSAAGCSSDVSRFGTLFEPTDNQAQIVRGPGPQSPDPMATGSLPPPQQPAPIMTAAPQPVVTSSLLPPAPGATASTAPFVRSDTGAMMAAAPPVAPAPAPMTLAPPPVAAAPTVASGSFDGWSAQGGTPVVIRPGETVQTISRRYGVPESALLAVNGLKRGATVQPGQQLVVPMYSRSAPSAPPAATAAAPAGAGSGTGVHVVKPGESLGRLAVAYGFPSSREFAAYNGIDPYAPIRIGQKLKVPTGNAPAQPTQVAAAGGATLTDAAPVQAPARVPVPKVAPEQPKPARVEAPKVVEPKVAAKPQPTSEPVTTPARQELPGPPEETVRVEPQRQQIARVEQPEGAGVESDSSGSFRWPVRGRVVSGFGVKPNGERNDGINIEVPEGTPIKASEGGEVIYAGNELKGYGNLVLVKHPSGYVSAYAHASEVLVERGDTVMRGQTIAKVGSTGNVSRPQLHFEIRKGNRPVDPIPHLGG